MRGEVGVEEMEWPMCQHAYFDKLMFFNFSLGFLELLIDFGFLGKIS